MDRSNAYGEQAKPLSNRQTRDNKLSCLAAGQDKRTNDGTDKKKKRYK